MSRRIRRRGMERSAASVDCRRVAARGSADDDRERHAGALVDEHAVGLLRLAWFVSGDCAVASSAVVRVIVAAAREGRPGGPTRATARELSRLTLWASLTPGEAAIVSPSGAREHASGNLAANDVVHAVPPKERALLALTMFGSHTYREAARVLGLEPETAARLMRSGLHAVADGYAGSPGWSNRQ